MRRGLRGRRRGQLLLAALALLTLVWGGLPGAPAAAAVTWQAAVGAQSPDKAVQVEQFFPNDLTVDVGDTVTWSWQSAEPHTVTFLSGAPRPSPQSPPTTRTTYDGTGIANSGLLDEGNSYSLMFLAVGDFPFVCLLHPSMTGTLHVQSSGTAYPHDQAYYDQQAAQQRAPLLARGQQLVATGLSAANAVPTPPSVTAGIGDGIVDVMRFERDAKTIQVGQTVVWTNRDTETPHTVTFGPVQPGPPQTVVGTDAFGHATLTSSSQSISSGFIGANFPGGKTFEVTFSQPGTYQYLCLLHAGFGMVGTIVVQPTPAGTAPFGYTQVNLVSDGSIQAAHTDPKLVNPWGIALGGTTPFWVANNHTGTSTLYNTTGTPQSLVVTVPTPPGGTPPSAPTGVVFNPTTDFPVTPGNPARFIFATEDGTISAWTLGTTTATLKVDNSAAGAIYKGLALASPGRGNYLYAANFHAGRVDVFDKNFQAAPTGMFPFSDPSIPAGFAPFGIQSIGDNLYVAYAKQDAAAEDDVPGPGNGYVNVFNAEGALLRRFASNGPLNSPWGMVAAPATFGRFGGALLIGNFGDGKINAFDRTSGAFLGTVSDPSGAPIVNGDLWGLTFGNGGSGGNPRTLYFTAGLAGEQHGLFGAISPVALADVPPAAFFYAQIELLFQQGVTTGFPCGTTPAGPCDAQNRPYFLDGLNVNRAQLAVFLVRAKHGASYAPPAATGTKFADVTNPADFFAPWIEQLLADGVTTGFPCGTAPAGACGTGNKPYFLPNLSVNRAQLAVFLVRAKHGASYAPPAATGTKFADVTNPADFFAPWIEQLATEGITTGFPCGTAPASACGAGNLPYYLGGLDASRGQMSAFLARTFFP